MKVICFGDSNTFGYDPRSRLGGRYGAESRWVDLLAAETGWTVCNMGENGREIPAALPVFPPDTDLLLLMLGTNDLLQGRSPEQAAEKLRRLLSAPPLDREKILLIAPPPMAPGEWVPGQTLVDASRDFARRCRALAGGLGLRFADAGDWNISLSGPLRRGFWRRCDEGPPSAAGGRALPRAPLSAAPGRAAAVFPARSERSTPTDEKM